MAPRDEVGRLDVREIGPAGRAVQIGIRGGCIGHHHPPKNQTEQANTRHHDARTAGLHQRVRIGGMPFDGPLEHAPGQIDPVEVRPERRVIQELPGIELRRRLQPCAK